MYVYMYVCVYVLYNYMHYIFFILSFFVCIYRFSTRCILTTTTTLYFPLLEYYFHIIEYKKESGVLAPWNNWKAKSTRVPIYQMSI